MNHDAWVRMITLCGVESLQQVHGQVTEREVKKKIEIKGEGGGEFYTTSHSESETKMVIRNGWEMWWYWVKIMDKIIFQCKERQKEIGMFHLPLFHTDFIIYLQL